MNLFVFDIETIPDTMGAQKLYGLEGLTDQEVVDAALALCRPNTFLPLYLQKIIAISLVFRSSQGIKIWSLGKSDADEKEIIERFFHGIDKYTPTLVSWNGSGFDLPVLHYRALFHGIKAERYWETGEQDNQFRYNNYLSRYHYRHLDLMDILACYQNRAYAPLDGIARLLGCPGKLGIDGSQVWPLYQQGQLETIRNYCETDVLNTYLVYLSFERLRGRLNNDNYLKECALLQQTLEESEQAHLLEFLAAWRRETELIK